MDSRLSEKLSDTMKMRNLDLYLRVISRSI